VRDFPLYNPRRKDSYAVVEEAANQNYLVYGLYHDLVLEVEKQILREIVALEGEIENLVDGHVGKEDISTGLEVGVVLVVEIEVGR